MPNRLTLFRELAQILDAGATGVILLYHRAGVVERYHALKDDRVAELTGDLVLHHQFGVLKSYNLSDRRKVDEPRLPGEDRRRTPVPFKPPDDESGG